jgi:UDP-N-acetylmuramoyl-tripeptide--D-alanyl-D-alanine ligase
MRVEGETLRVRIHGRYNLYNGLAAVAVGRALGVDWETIGEAIESYHPMEKRMEMLRFGGIVVLNDTYNANPSSVRCALETLHHLNDVKRKIAVLGDMLELGGKSDEEHRHVGGWVVALGLDYFFGYGKGMQLAVEKARDGGLKSASHHATKEDLLNAIRDVVVQGDAVLVKGSRGMRMEEIVEGLRGDRRQETGDWRPTLPPPANE